MFFFAIGYNEASYFIQGLAFIQDTCLSFTETNNYFKIASDS